MQSNNHNQSKFRLNLETWNLHKLTMYISKKRNYVIEKKIQKYQSIVDALLLCIFCSAPHVLILYWLRANFFIIIIFREARIKSYITHTRVRMQKKKVIQAAGQININYSHIEAKKVQIKWEKKNRNIQDTK